MGYNYRLSVVEDNEELLTAIEKAVSDGVPLVFDSESIEDLMRLRYKILEVLKCTEVFPEAFEGRFEDLKSRCLVRLKVDAKCLIVEAKQSKWKVTTRASTANITEFEVLEHLMKGVDLFYPVEFRLRESSSTIESVISAAAIAGYEVEQQESRGTRTYFMIFSKTSDAPTASTKRSVFDVLDVD
jgi:hypothetical protein